jgi:hypothetical protein
MRRAVVLALTVVLLAPASAGAAVRRVDLPGGPSALAVVPGGIAVASQTPMTLTRVGWDGRLITQQKLAISCNDALYNEEGPIVMRLAAEGSSLALALYPQETGNFGHGALVSIDGTTTRLLSCGPYDHGYEPSIVGDGQQIVETLPGYSAGCDSVACDEVLTLLDPITNTVFGTSYTYDTPLTTSCAPNPTFIGGPALMQGTLYGVTSRGEPFACRLDGTPVWIGNSLGPTYYTARWLTAVSPTALVAAAPGDSYGLRVYDPKSGVLRMQLPKVGVQMSGLAVLGDTVAWIANGNVYVEPADGHLGRRLLAHLPRTITPTGLIATPHGLAWTGLWFYHSRGALWLASTADIERALRPGG